MQCSTFKEHPPCFRRGVTNPDDDIFEFDADYLDRNAEGDPFDASDVDSEGSYYFIHLITCQLHSNFLGSLKIQVILKE